MLVYSGKIKLNAGAGHEATVRIAHVNGMAFHAWADAIAHERWATAWEALFNREETQ